MGTNRDVKTQITQPPLVLSKHDTYVKSKTNYAKTL